MQVFIKNTAARFMALSLVCLAMFSFVSPLGTDSFEVYLNKKLILQDYVSSKTSVKSFSLDASQADAQIDVYYNHCGALGKSRNIVLKDAKDNVIKTWHFSDGNKFMSFKLKDIPGFQKLNGGKINLFYNADLLPEGRLLANMVINKENKAVSR